MLKIIRVAVASLCVGGLAGCIGEPDPDADTDIPSDELIVAELDRVPYLEAGAGVTVTGDRTHPSLFRLRPIPGRARLLLRQGSGRADLHIAAVDPLPEPPSATWLVCDEVPGVDAGCLTTAVLTSGQERWVRVSGSVPFSGARLTVEYGIGNPND